ncbi:hypothetical protein PITC_009040 [Penicillium italicum]|uniref:Uncharacterized protein n=1 Tax=Penicillium italicum TaxID=40296 RepID=A0A0A2L1N1_PENIT|nr:hypothetical protein PITC_009040 [Penicillium italicum]
MAPPSYFNSVTSESVFKARFQAEHGKSFSEIKAVGASNWDRTHLLACRVVRPELRGNGNVNVLPSVSNYAHTSDTEFPPDEMKAFLKGPGSSIKDKSEHYLVRQLGCSISLGQIWAAMAMFTGSLDRREQNLSQNEGSNEDSGDYDHDIEERPKRARRDTIQVDGYIDSDTMQVGSSSPVPGSSDHSASLAYVDRDTHILAVQPEDESLRLASCVIRHILYYGTPQDSTDEPVVTEFRDGKRRLDVSTINSDRQIVAIDDGGLCLRRHEPGRGYVVVENTVAILETKTRGKANYLR